jgi:hypothetical protein
MMNYAKTPGHPSKVSGNFYVLNTRYKKTAPGASGNKPTNSPCEHRRGMNHDFTNGGGEQGKSSFLSSINPWSGKGIQGESRISKQKFVWFVRFVVKNSSLIALNLPGAGTKDNAARWRGTLQRRGSSGL